jgi:hypothetical protein
MDEFILIFRHEDGPKLTRQKIRFRLMKMRKYFKLLLSFDVLTGTKQ